MKLNFTPRRARFWRASLLFLLPLLLFAVIRERQSWQPRMLNSNTGFVTALAWSPDGRFLAAGSQEICIWDVATRRIQCRIGRTSAMSKMQFSPDGSAIYYVGGGLLRGIAVPSGRELPLRWRVNNADCAFSPDGHYFAQQEKNNLVVRELPSLALCRTLPLGTQSPKFTAFSPDGRRLGAVLSPGLAGQPHHFVLWALPPEKSAKAMQLARMEVPPEMRLTWTTLAPEMLTQGQLIVFADNRHAVFASPDFWLFDAQSDTAVRAWESGQDTAFTASPDGAVYAGVRNNYDAFEFLVDSPVLYFADINAKRRLESKSLEKQHWESVCALAFSPDSRDVAVVSNFGRIVLWRVQ